MSLLQVDEDEPQILDVVLMLIEDFRLIIDLFGESLDDALNYKIFRAWRLIQNVNQNLVNWHGDVFGHLELAFCSNLLFQVENIKNDLDIRL